MKKPILLLLLMFLCIWNANAQTANFNIDKPLGNSLPHLVKFTDTSIDPDIWQWNFGDGGTSSAKNPTHNFNTVGEFDVTLIVRDSTTGGSDQITKQVRISRPNADFGIGNFIGCAPHTTGFNNVSTGDGAALVSWEWDFGDGTTGTGESPTHTYTSPGEYFVTLTVTDAFGNTDLMASSTSRVIVFGSTADFTTSDPTTGCAPLTINFDNLSTSSSVILESIWTLGDGNSVTTSLDDDLTYTYITQGTYDVTLQVKDLDGCSNTITKVVYVNTNDAISPIPDQATLPNATGQCSVTLTPPTATDNCAGTINATTSDPLSYNSQGTFTVTWTYDDGNGNSVNQSQTVIVDDVTDPVPDLATLPDATGECSVTVTPPTASDNCGSTINATTSDPLTYTAQGTFTVTWTYDDGNGNTVNQSQTVIVDDVTDPVPDLATLPNVTGECSVTVTPPTASDNCAGAITATTSDPLTYTAQGTYSINWTYDDGNGNTVNQSQTVIVDDVTKPVPVLSTLPDATGECSVTVTPPLAVDNCAGNLTATTSDPLTYNAQGTFSITWNFNDGNGNSINQTQTVIVKDISEPVPDITNLPDAIGECSVTVSAPTATDNCAGAITATTSDPLTYTSQGTYTVNWSYNDGLGNIETQTQTVIVDDISAPVPDIATLPNATGECSVTVTAPTATDNCNGPITATTSDPLTYTSQGTFIINWIYDDGLGNTLSQPQTVIVNDITDPIPDLATLPDATGECSVTVTPPTATDNCSGVVTATTSDPLTYNTQGTFTVNWTYDDGQGNTINQSQTVIVSDITDPVPDLATLAAATGECSVTVTAPTATDNCSGVVTATTSDPTTYNVQGTYTVAWTYNDGNGNSIVQNQTVIVDDISDPIPDLITLPDVVGECQVNLTAPTATDNCSGLITATTSDPITYTLQGTYTVDWTYDDGNGNSVIQSQTVIVDDVSDPVPAIATLPDAIGECSVTVTAPTANDNCSGIITATTSDPLTYNSQGTFTINWDYNDGNGNSTSQIQTVIVKDLTAPVPDVAGLPTITGQCTASVIPPTATDNCSGLITATTVDPLTYTVQGTYTVNWLYEDGHGNSTSQTQTVIVKDTTDPVPDLTSLPAVTGECNATVIAPTATDNCSGLITATTSDPLTYNTQGTFTVNWTYDDGNGNTFNQSQLVIIKDESDPVPNLVNLPIVSGECSATVTAPTANDNCSGVITGTTGDPLTYNVQGTYTVNWTYDDGNGNSVLQTQTVIIDDVSDPIPDVSDLPTITGECSATVTAPTAIDNCSGAITATTSDPLTYNSQGTFTVNWTYDDGNGNIIVQPQTVVVDDVTKPIPDVTDLPVITAECNVTVIAPTATDNCAGVITATTTDAVSYAAQGTYTVNWSYDDGQGNVKLQPQTIIIKDITKPVPENTTLPDVVADCSVTLVPPLATDNCSGSITATTSDPITYNSPGVYNVNWSYDDGNGNLTVQSQSVTVEDNAAPVPDVAVLPTITSECGVTLIAPTSTDNCSGAITATTNHPLTIAVQGTFNIEWIYDDGHGNKTFQNQTVIIDDITSPVPDVTDLPELSGSCSVTATPPGATDNCAGAVKASTNDPLMYTEQGTYTILWTYDDGHGNTTTQTQSVVVDDSIAPVVTCVAPFKIQLDDNGQAEISAETIGNNLNDACGIASVEIDVTTFTCADVGDNVVTLTVEDIHGNITSCSTTVTVEDNIKPIVNCVDPFSIILDSNKDITIDVSDIDNGSTDNCGIASATLDITSFGVANIGDNTVTLTVTDIHGNVSTCTTVVTVENIQTPSLFTPNNDGVNDRFEIPGLANLYPNFEMRVFNRWGNILYEYKNHGKTDPDWWDGFSQSRATINKNGMVPSGTYFYVIKLNDGNSKPLSGWVYLNN